MMGLANLALLSGERSSLKVLGPISQALHHAPQDLDGLPTVCILHVLRLANLDSADTIENRYYVYIMKIVASESIRDTGAVASSRAAEIGLDILAQTIQVSPIFSNIHFSFCLTIFILNVQDDLDNITRFLILAREPIIQGIDKPHKTSIVFTLEEGPRVLFNGLAVFALREINLSKVTFSTTSFYLSR
uniref:Uncharacterized protein n=1 Tax=Lactuca sativa TaxID=4236 RepID=A0A9R1UMH2_LACSA|nr:hypothetical protein LSAT_V11C800401920 [Lactuca sativa]